MSDTDQPTVGTAVHRFFRAVDVRDWDTVRHGLSDHVHTDYTSLFDGRSETIPRDELVARWRQLLPGFDATQHLLGPLAPSAPGAWECNVRGYHHVSGRASAQSGT